MLILEFYFSQMIKIVIFVVFLIIIICFLIYLIIRNESKPIDVFNDFQGGDGISTFLYKKSEVDGRITEFKRTLSFAELALRYKSISISGNTSIIPKIEIDHLIGLSAREYEKLSYFKYRDMDGYISKNIQPKFFSDSLLDGLLFMKIPNVENVFCKNEYNSERLFNEIDSSKINYGFTEDRKTQLSYHLRSHQIQGIDNCEIISMENRDKLNKHNFFTNNNLYEDVVYIFIEFSYPGTIDKREVLKYYKLIHSKTQEIMKIIIDEIEDTTPVPVYVIRILLSEIDSPIVFTRNVYRDINISTYLGDYKDNSTEFNTINIPKTKDSFAMDEFLIVDYNFPDANCNVNYFVQIEHSEGMQHHKSNRCVTR